MKSKFIIGLLISTAAFANVSTKKSISHLSCKTTRGGESFCGTINNKKLVVTYDESSRSFLKLVDSSGNSELITPQYSFENGFFPAVEDSIELRKQSKSSAPHALIASFTTVDGASGEMHRHFIIYSLEKNCRTHTISGYQANLRHPEVLARFLADESVRSSCLE